MTSPSLDRVADVDIDGHGRFKYILINVEDSQYNVSKIIVRGHARAQWHADIFEEVQDLMKAIPGLHVKCLGGGLIEHDPDRKKIEISGYSQGFGRADHQLAMNLLEKKYPGYFINLLG